VHGEKAEVWRLKTSPENDGEASRRFEGVWSCVWIWNPYLSEKRVGDDGVDEKSFDVLQELSGSFDGRLIVCGI